MDLRAVVKNAYHKDTICVKIIVQPDAYPRFAIREGLIWTKNQLKRDVICIPRDAFQRGRRLIEIIIDHPHLVPTTMQVTTKEVAWLFLKEVMRLHGVPESIVSDRDNKFMSTFWCELHRLMGTKLLMSTAFHPQMDGATDGQTVL